MELTSTDHDLRLESPWAIGERSGLLILVALVPTILVLDFVSGREVSLHLFYVVPVALAGWILGRRAGYVIAMAAGVSWAFVAIASRAPAGAIGPVAWDVASTFALYLFVGHLVARHRGYVEGVRTLARVDAETGALSRREFDRVLEAEVRRSKRYRRPLALVVFEVAESRGEGRGFLPAVVRAVQGLVREGDGVSRLSPRRFAVLLIECKAPEPMLVVERLCEGLAANQRVRKQDLAVAVATYGGGVPATGTSLLAAAEGHLNLARSGTGVAETRID
ncbi:MAG: GGDEF domain-containing protein [Burkholderiales bacterium]|nr:GGDEF domain-containing protein [Burkholderiales bacterium]